MSDSFTEVSSQGWFSRLGGAVKGVIAGAGLTAMACGLLFWNEGRAVKTARALDEGQGIAVSVPADSVGAGNEGKLVVTTGEARGTEPVKDEAFGIVTDGISLQRKVSYYQWVEEKESKTEKKLGGGTETVTRYTYSTRWVSSPVRSSNFKEPKGHLNPDSVRYKDEGFRAKEVKLGAFTLSEGLVRGITRSESLPVTEAQYQALPETLRTQARWSGGAFYFGMNPASPEVGDEKVEFEVVRPQVVTVAARQSSSSLGAFTASNGNAIEIVKAGTYSKDQLFEAAKSDNVTVTWFLRFLGFVVCFVGFSMILKPLSVLADVVPFIGDLVGMGTSMISFVAAFTLSTVSIALGWFAYRPFLSLGLLTAAGGAAFYLFQKKRQAAAKRAETGATVTPMPARPEVEQKAA
jgi:hypothetical protein